MRCIAPLVGYNNNNNYYYYLICNKCGWKNCFVKNNQEILLDLADFALQEKPEDNLTIIVLFLWHGIMAYIP